MSHAAGTSVRLLYPFAAALREEGVRTVELLDAAGIAQSTYDDQDARIKPADLFRFITAAEQRSGHPAVGLVAARHHDLAQFHALEYLASSSSDVAAAWDSLLRYQRLFSSLPVMTVEQHGDQLVLRYGLDGAKIPRSGQDYVVGALSLMAYRMMAGAGTPAGNFEAKSFCAWFSYDEPPSAQTYREFFRSRVRWGAPVTGIAVSASSIARPMLQANPQLKEVLESEVMDMVRRVDARRSLRDRVCLELADSLADPALGLEWLGHKLHMSRSTLKRRLAEEGTSYSDLLDEMRKARALRYLRDRSMSLDEVAFLLGYEDVSALHKACKRWTGLTPGQLRPDKG